MQSQLNPSPLSNSHKKLPFDLSKLRLPPSSVARGDEIGHGAFGTVYKGLYAGKPVAIKQMRIINSSVAAVDKIVQNELKILLRLQQYDFITKVFGYQFERQYVSIVLSFAENGDLRNFLSAGKLKGQWLEKARICAEIAEAVDAIHSECIIHGDLKAANILLDGSLKAILADFGISRSLSSISNGRTPGNTFRYVAPERLRQSSNEKLTRQESKWSDIFSYGLIVWEVATDGKQPYPGSDKVVFRAKYTESPQHHLHHVGKLPDDAPQVFKFVARQCLEWQPSRRPSLAYVRDKLNAYQSGITQSLDDSDGSLSNNSYELLLDARKTAENFFATNIENGSKIATRIHVNNMNFPTDKEQFMIHLEKLKLQKLYQHLVWVPFELFSDVAPLGKGRISTVYRGTVRWALFKFASFCELSEVGSRKYSYNLNNQETERQYALKEFYPEMNTEVMLTAYISLVSETSINMELIGLSYNPATDKYLMVMEYGDKNLEQYVLFGFIPNDSFWLSVWNLSVTLASRLRSFHHLDLIHHDLHPGNVIIHDNSCRLIDLGLAQIEGKQNIGNCERLEYTPPEILRGQPYTQASDVYCLGTLLWQLFTGLPPHGTAEALTGTGLREAFAPGMPVIFKNIIRDCWSLQPLDRPSAADVHGRLSSEDCEEEMRMCKLSSETQAFLVDRRTKYQVELAETQKVQDDWELVESENSRSDADDWHTVTLLDRIH
ncbi:kinase-like domain-containing protein [Jimgerdemannia flammicorona]|uniref:Kinase-like domain-containing protein n=1 Tax=Jimgerdemannia flammicorona TaxID=994334 RepID=A0A433D756_9FUNG|nr:kinase-like domain-containing protein [Jimgerdemannia flammicorona]